MNPTFYINITLNRPFRYAIQNLELWDVRDPMNHQNTSDHDQILSRGHKVTLFDIIPWSLGLSGS